ncbi:MAG: hypothetical protein WA821_09040 [Anaerolineales bacterium]
MTYAKDGNIWLVDASALPKRLTNTGRDSAPKISDDGLVVAFLRGGEMWAIGANGDHERLLASAHDLASLSRSGSPTVWTRQFDFAPHSHVVYLNIEFATVSIPGPEYNLARVNADSPALQALLDASQGGGQFIFSPDGAKIALPRNDKINVVNADGAGLKTVFTFPPVMMYSEFNYIPDVVWLPDGSGFKTVIPAQDPLGNPSSPTRFMFIPADGGPAAQLAEFVASPAFSSRPVISPDGARVLYTKTRGTNLELHIIDASTADQMYFSHAADTFGILGWAPDSTHVLYWLDDRNLVWLGPQQSDAILLSDAPGADNFAWVDTHSYLFVAHAWELRFCVLGQPSILIDDGLSDSAFDFTTLH